MKIPLAAATVKPPSVDHSPERNCRCTTVRVVGAKMERNRGCGRIMGSRNPGRKLCELSWNWQLRGEMVALSSEYRVVEAHSTLRLYTGLADSQHND